MGLFCELFSVPRLGRILAQFRLPVAQGLKVEATAAPIQKSAIISTPPTTARLM